MNQPKPGTIKYSDLISEIENGRIKIPQFQREFVWSKTDAANLMDSIIKGYPIGTFILWKTVEQLRSIKNIGNLSFPDTPVGDAIQYVLDGQQRMTSIFCCIKGVSIKNTNGKEVDYSEIYIDLAADESEQIIVTDKDVNIDDGDPGQYIKVSNVYNGNLMKIAREYSDPLKNKFFDKISDYSERLKTYDFSTISVEYTPIDIATEIFTRINVGGKSLSVFEIMVAKTFDNEREFDLFEKYNRLLETIEDVGYETIPSSTVLQCVSVCMEKECSKTQILKLDKNLFIDIWNDVESAICSAIDYFRTNYYIPVSDLLPYYGMLVPFTYFFYKNKTKPVGDKQKYLQDFFWRTVINSRYSHSLETVIGQDIKRIDKILKGELPEYEYPVDISVESLRNNGYFSTGRAYIKGLLCVLASKRPLSFNDNSYVIINNSYLKQANSKNYHHFFPKAYLSKRGYESDYINHIANITIVDDFLNKREIRDKAPSVYIEKFAKINKNLDNTLRTHLIKDVDDFGIYNDDYDTFFDKRLYAFSNELKERLIIRDNDVLSRNE